MKKSTPGVSLVIPLFNNEKTLVKQLRSCEKLLKRSQANFEIIICDDKSIDTSATLLKKFFANNKNFKLFFHKKNRGIANTLKFLYRKAQFDYIILFSVDGDWQPKDIGRLLHHAIVSDADMVIGKRTYTDYSMYRKIISFFYNFLPILFFQIRTVDAGSIKIFRKQKYLQTKIVSKSVFFEAEFIIRLKKQGGKISNIPITFKKKKTKGSGGKLSLVFYSLLDLINLRFRL